MSNSRKSVFNRATVERCDPALLKLIGEAGGVRALADKVGMWHTRLYAWIEGKHEPTPHCSGYRKLSDLALARTGRSLEELLGIDGASPLIAAQLEWLPERALVAELDEDAMIARLDVERALRRVAIRQPRRAEALRRYYLRGENYAEIGEAMNISPQRAQGLASEGELLLARKLRKDYWR